MEKKQLIIRITLWWGIVADAFEGIRMFFPNLFSGFHRNESCCR